MNRVVALMLVLSGGTLGAQTAPPPPSPPYVRAVGPGQMWTVAIEEQESDDVKAAPKKPEKEEKAGTEAEKPKVPVPVKFTARWGTNGILEGTVDFSDGEQQRFYIAGRGVFQKATDSGRVLTLPTAGQVMDWSSFKMAQLPGLGWVKKSNFAGWEKRDGQDVMRFFLIETAGNPPEPLPKKEAWIRAADRQPLEFHNGGRIQRYSEPVAFAESITPPEDVAKAMAKYEVEQKAGELLKKINDRNEGR